MMTPDHERSFLPDFCSLPMVFGVVVLSELFAFVLVLAGPAAQRTWSELALVSLYMQWAGLTGALLLCLLRRPLGRLGDVGAGMASYLLLLLVVLALSEAAYRLLEGTLPGEAGDHAAFLLRNLAIGAIVAGIILRYFYIRHQWRRQVQAESAARLEALQARIRPHFLFNSLNTAAALAHERPDLAERTLLDLADLFRASIGDARALVPLAEELALARGYLEIERLRLGGRLRVAWALDGVPQTLPVPPLVLQPLVENAVYHGIEPHAGGGEVRIEARAEADALEISVGNPLPPSQAAQTRGNGMALENIRQRLAAQFGADARLTTARSGGEFRVRVRIPQRSGE